MMTMTDLPAWTRLLQRPALLLAVLWMASCTSSTPKIAGIPSDLPDIPLYGSAATPPHSMSKGEYPFDSRGNYVTAWAAQGSSTAAANPSPVLEVPSSRPTKSSKGSATKPHVEDSPPEPKPKVASAPPTVHKPDNGDAPKRKGGAPAKPGTSEPVKKTTTATEPAKKRLSSGNSVKHVVKSGDTLSGLAKRYGTTMAKIKAANGLKSDLLRDGRTLIIPQ